LMLGITFKENCPDVRNTKIVDVIGALEDYGIKVSLYDPWANPVEVLHEYGLETSTAQPTTTFDSVVLGVAHQEFLDLDINALKNENCIVYDVKGVLGDASDGRL
jgi:UDP-N-acetyl-D-galactosamine dehydrogenase